MREEGREGDRDHREAIKERDRLSGVETGERITLFKAVFVFDKQQVAPLPDRESVALEPPQQPLSGESHRHLLEPLQAFAQSLGFTVAFQRVSGAAGGWCDASAKQIVVDAAAPGNSQLRTLIHETAHALGVGYADYGRARAEVIVDVAICAISTVGIDVSAYSIPYLCSWSEDTPIQTIQHTAELIDELAKRLEDALNDTPATTDDSAPDSDAELVRAAA